MICGGMLITKIQKLCESAGHQHLFYRINKWVWEHRENTFAKYIETVGIWLSGFFECIDSSICLARSKLSKTNFQALGLFSADPKAETDAESHSSIDQDSAAPATSAQATFAASPVVACVGSIAGMWKVLYLKIVKFLFVWPAEVAM